MVFLSVVFDGGDVVLTSLLLVEFWVLVWVVNNATLCPLGMGTCDLASGYLCMHFALVARMLQGFCLCIF